MRKHVGKVEVLVYPVYCYTTDTRLTNPILNVIELFKINKKYWVLLFQGLERRKGCSAGHIGHAFL